MSQPEPRITGARRPLANPRAWLTAAAILLAGLLLFLALRQITWAELWQTLRNLRLEYIGFGLLTGTHPSSGERRKVAM